ncbi:MAG: N-acetylmuramoyl-L-alanine amidase [Cytophagales bacterium]|nr:N-acetylmuramoyl-L-alanine amidase [Armatimonadota bacterium]
MLITPRLYLPNCRARIGATTAAGLALLCGTMLLPAAASAPSLASASARAKLPLAVAAAPVTAGPQILFGGAVLAVPSEALAPFRDLDDGKVYVAPEMLAPLGVTFMVDGVQGKVSLAGPDGAASTIVTARVRPGSEKDREAPVFVPAQEVIEALGGRCVWSAATNTLSARSVLTEVRMLAGQLRIKATLPVFPQQVRSPEKPGMVILDFPGTVIEGQPRPLDLNAPGIAQARIGQFGQETARVVLEMAGDASATRFYVLGGKPAALVVLNPAPVAPVSPIAAAAPPPSIVISNNNPSRTLTTKSGRPAANPRRAAGANPAPTVIRGVTFRRVSDEQMQIVVAAGRAPAVRADLSRGRLTVDIVNATLAATAGSALGAARHPFLKAVSVLPRGATAAQLVMDLTRTVTFAVRMSPTGGFVLDLMMPRSAGGKLAGKLVVIDPGHGGNEPGATGVDGSNEKNVTLAISLKLADTLRDMGANVILTRGNDAFVPVGERPKIANRAGADFFLSIHADSADRNRSVNGSTVYYHMQVGSSKALAQSIADRFSDMGGIRTKGTHSDGRQWGGRFENGYGVLRGARMVAVLCETGYMSNAGDVNKLNNAAMQKRIAQAIAGGLRDYVEGNPNFDTRNIRPQADGPMAPLSSVDPAPLTRTSVPSPPKDAETVPLGEASTEDGEVIGVSVPVNLR